MQYLLVATTFVNLVFGISLYIILNKSKMIFSDRFGYTMSMSSSSTISLVASINMVMLFPDSIEIIGALSIMLGVAIGWQIGSMLNSQSLIAGVYHGGMGGIMGTMTGAALQNPTICGLSASILTPEETILFFALLSIVLLGITVMLLLYSFRV